MRCVALAGRAAPSRKVTTYLWLAPCGVYLASERRFNAVMTESAAAFLSYATSFYAQRARMTSSIRVTGQAYYDVMPGADLQAGDIWLDMPTFGHWRRLTANALVITPACDLSNRKSETVSYVPVVPLREYVLGRGFAVEMVRVIKAQESIAGISQASDWIAKASNLPGIAQVQCMHSSASAQLEKKIGEKALSASRRCEAASKVLLASRGAAVATIEDVKSALGDKEYLRIVSDIVRNAYSSDIHFLPADGRIGMSSAMKEHSVALFRYPLSLPVEVLDYANDIAVIDWPRVVSSMENEYPIMKEVGVRPLKIGSLRSPYLADLISRFAGLHIRMGSPDFTSETVGRYVNDIRSAP